MKISIVTVCYNSAETIRDTLESVKRQTYSDIEYIIIDGGSDDGTLSIINEYEDCVSKVISEPDDGIYDAMNKGVLLSTGDYIGILNSDDFFKDEKVIALIVEDVLLSNSDIVYGDVLFVDPLNTKKVVRFYDSKNFKRWKLRFGLMPPHPATFIKKSVYLRAGQYSSEYEISADYEMFVRLIYKMRVTFSRCNAVIVHMRMGGVSTNGWRSSLSLNREIVKACKANGLYTNLFLVLMKVPFKLIEFIKRPPRVYE